MLTLKNLNDRSYQDILNKAKEMIPHIFPEWTDLRAHDPGITFVELFAWLIEMLESYQNKITYRNRLKFLKLLNVRPKAPERAYTYIEVKDVLKPSVIPAGTRIFSGNVPFETEESITLKPFKIDVIAVNDRESIYEVFSGEQKKEIEYPAFGDSPITGNAMNIGMDGEYHEGTLCLKIDIAQNKWARNIMTSKDFFEPLSRVKWECLENAAEDKWCELEVLYDETHELTFSGIIKLQLPKIVERGNLKGINRQGLFYIRCRLVECGYEIPPRIKLITLNNIKAIHGITLSKSYYFSGSKDKNLSLELDGYLPLFGKCRVKVKNSDGFWIEWEEKNPALQYGSGEIYKIDVKKGKTTVTFGEAIGGKVPPKVMSGNNIMVIAYDESFYENSLITFQGPLPNQTIQLDWAINRDLISPVDFKIQVGSKLHTEKHFKWVDFKRVDDLDNSKGNKRHFVLDYQKRELHFGNNEMGAMPGSFGENVIEIVQCTIGGGTKGNVKERTITDICEPYKEKYKITNPYAAVGGHDGETLDGALRRLLSDMKKQYRAVTLKDYEDLALSTPGLMVAKAKAIPQFVKGQKDYPNTRSPGQLTVVVLPYSSKEKPMPSKAFIQRIKKYLDEFRLITTELHVIPPEYVKIRVSCTVVVLPHIMFDEKIVASMLKEFLNPIGGKNFSGWPIGGTVRKGDIISKISSIPGVEYVKDIQINTYGEDIKYEKNGDIIVPPYALVYSDEHDVEIISEE